MLPTASRQIICEHTKVMDTLEEFGRTIRSVFFSYMISERQRWVILIKILNNYLSLVLLPCRLPSVGEHFTPALHMNCGSGR